MSAIVQTVALHPPILFSMQNMDVAHHGSKNRFEPAFPEPSSNKILGTLQVHDLLRIKSALEPVSLKLGQLISAPNQPSTYLLFVTSGIVSMVQVMSDGRSGEIAIVGCEGVVGIALFMGGQSSPARAIVQSAGSGYQMEVSALMPEFNRTGEMQRLLLRYTQALMAQMSQTAVCNRHHQIHQQLARWLLMSIDRLSGNELLMTQELIANMLGVRREGVTEAARSLQERGLIRYVRGRIEVIDRPGLERAACECYGAVEKEYDRLLTPSGWRLHPAPAPA